MSIIKQYLKITQRFERIKGKHGFENVIVVEGKGVTIYKRLFHTSSAEKINGVDFVFTKMKRSRLYELAVQVKRNHNHKSFGFDSRDHKQLEKFSKYFPYGYYLFVDETGSDPTYCFLRISELKKILEEIGNKQSISNNLIKKYCRGSVIFYESFYRCRRGSKPKQKLPFIEKTKQYVEETERVVVELTDNKLNKKIKDYS